MRARRGRQGAISIRLRPTGRGNVCSTTPGVSFQVPWAASPSFAVFFCPRFSLILLRSGLLLRCSTLPSVLSSAAPEPNARSERRVSPALQEAPVRVAISIPDPRTLSVLVLPVHRIYHPDPPHVTCPPGRSEPPTRRPCPFPLPPEASRSDRRGVGQRSRWKTIDALRRS